MSQFGETFFWKNPHAPRDAATIPGRDNEIVRAGSVEQCYELWSARCREFGITFENEWRTFSDCNCRALPVSLRKEACGFLTDSNAPEVLTRQYLRGENEVMRFLHTVSDWFKSEESVSQDQANKRAETCAMCPHNQTAVGASCAGCNSTAKSIVTKIFQLIGQKKTPHDHMLNICGLCGCSLKVMVWTPLDALLKNQDGVPDAPSFCWKVSEQAHQ